MSELVIDASLKGWPDLGCTLAELPELSLHVDALPLPVMVLHESALAHNIAAMAAWCERRGALLAPHGKTTMAPQLFARQLAAGAWGITVATVQQARVAAAAGVERLLIANQLADPEEVRWAVAHDAPFLVDSLAGVDIARAGPGAAVLLEVGYPGGRGGVRSVDEALAVAGAAAEAGLRLAGVEAFEGLLASREEADAFLDDVTAIARAVAHLLEPDPLVTAGGSLFFDRVADRLGPVAHELGGRLVLRSGCYVTHDHGQYARLAPGELGLRPAIEVRARVLSRPEPERAILGAGKRDLAYDMDLPVLLDRPGRVVALNDQHAHVALPADAALRVGDAVRLGISHPCTAFERWRLIPVIDDDGMVVTGVATRF